MKNFFRIVLVAIPFALPAFSLGFDVGNLLTVVSLLFAILAGFFVAAATSNYLRHQSLIATENAALISIFQMARKVDPLESTKVADVIDQYLIATLDFDLLNYHEGTRDEFSKLLDSVDSVHAKDDEGMQLLSPIQDQKFNLININQESFLTAKTIVSPLHWFIITFLAALCALLVLALQDRTLIASLISGVLILSVFEVLELIHLIDSNVFLAAKLAYESPQPVFAALGRLNYYPETAVKIKPASALPKKYRVGVYENYPDSFQKTIKTVTR